MAQTRYQTSRAITNLSPNIWDIVVIILVLGILAALSWAAARMVLPYKVGEQIKITLDPWAIPGYAISSVLRMFIAMFFSILATLIIAPLAAKSRRAEKFLLPLIDVLQSIPVLGLLSITIVGFISLFPNSLLGPECAAVFAIFTSQVWNMVLSLYQSLRTVPSDLKEVARMYHLSAWQKFWKLEIPHSMQSLIWNTMVSMSAGWFFVVLSESIEVSNQRITLPGLGSYIALAMQEANLTALFYAIIAMLIIILLYDQLLFRPLLAWAEKFRSEIDEEDQKYESWLINLLTKTHLLQSIEILFNIFTDWFINGYKKILPRKDLEINVSVSTQNYINNTTSVLWNIGLIVVLTLTAISLVTFIQQKISFTEILHVVYLGALTALKVFVLIVLASAIWIPIGAWIGLRPKLSSIIQPLIQFLAAFPANLFYPLFVFFILHFNLNHNIWTMPLMILGTQWYILFNVISGTARIPKDIRLAAKNFGVKGTLWWRKILLPGVFPNYVTGAMAAAGGCWNASIVAEYVVWGDHTIISTGLGQYITQYTQQGDFPRIALGISVMCLYVLVFTRLIWQRLYQFAATRFTMDV
jgi:NitT/TauT family transport system permease protein